MGEPIGSIVPLLQSFWTFFLAARRRYEVEVESPKATSAPQQFGRFFPLSFFAEKSLLLPILFPFFNKRAKIQSGNPALKALKRALKCVQHCIGPLLTAACVRPNFQFQPKICRQLKGFFLSSCLNLLHQS